MEIKIFLSLNCPECNEGQFRDQKSRDLHEKSRDLSNYENFQHKILKSQSLKKSSILVFLCHAEHLSSHWGHFRNKKSWSPWKIPWPIKLLTKNRWMQKLRQNDWKKSAKTWKCAYWQIEPKTQNMYSLHSSLVEHQLPVRGGVVQS
jgi:hypothetical protein